MSKVRHHICAGKVGDVGQEISGKMNFLSRLAPPYLTDNVDMVAIITQNPYT